MKPFVTSFRVPVYESRVFVGVARCGSELVKVLPKRLRYEPDDNTRGEMTNYHNGQFLVALFDVTHNTIAHECWHLTSAILRFHEVKRDEEAFAYLTGKIHEKVYRLLEKKSVAVTV